MLSSGHTVRLPSLFQTHTHTLTEYGKCCESGTTRHLLVFYDFGRLTYLVFLTLGGDGCSTPLSGRFTSEKDLVPFYRMLGETQGRSGQVQEISLLLRINPPTNSP
jgi:hypothetical protein